MSSATEAVLAAAGDDESDWEYEYSSTESETHLITLDLSLPDFLRRKEEIIVHSTRAGYKPWLQPILTGNDGAIDTATGRQAHDRKVSDRSADDMDPSAVQVLDLHTAAPLIAYGGMVFRGEWTESIGTEMLFTEHHSSAGTGAGVPASSTSSPSSTIPTRVRHLPQDVDLLGASAARIACAPVELRSKEAARNMEEMRRQRKKLGFSISAAASGTSEARQKQAAFLENLMALKHRRGEVDVVTVQALETSLDTVHDDEEEDRLRRKKMAQLVRYQRRMKRQREEQQAAAAAAAAAEAAVPAVTVAATGAMPVES